jgi:hypothetical protein
MCRRGQGHYSWLKFRDESGGYHLDGRGAGVGFPILLGAYLLYSNLSESALYSVGPQANYHAALSALGAFLIILGLVFLFKNLK